MSAFRAVLVCTVFVVALASCRGCRRSPNPPGPAQATRVVGATPVAEEIYDGGLKNDWQDYGWAKRDVKGPGPASVSFANWGGWIIAKPSLHGRFGGLLLRVRSESGKPEWLEVRLESPSSYVFPRVQVRSEHRMDVGDGWVEVLIGMSELNPGHLPFDRLVLRAFRPLDGPPALIDKIALTQVDAAAEAAMTSKLLAQAQPALMRIDCRASGQRVSPWIYGIAYYALKDASDTTQWNIGATIRRWGGNTTSRYNWELGDAWNTGLDWFWENVKVPPYTEFLRRNIEHGLKSALTVPMLGWVAKDTTSSSFPISRFPSQEKTDEYRPSAGNGRKNGGSDITPPDPSTTGVAASPDFVRRWVEAIRAKDQEARARSVDVYILDNEPALWNSTHRDVHPDPLTYDELLDRTLRYGAAVRQADKDAVIAGPAAWGWPEYNYSAKDMRAGTFLRPDRRAHGDVPLLAWYLKRLREEEDKTGVHILDIVDVHFYPQAKGLYGGETSGDAATRTLRIRSTRALWDPSYVDESYIKEPINLLPRLHDWIAKNFPGRGIQIGEWNFGGEAEMSGGLAVAEALGRFAQNDVTAAYYWTVPPADSPASYAFRAYRNFDGQGGHFLDYSLPTWAPDQTSLFASRDASGKHLVAVALNFSPEAAFVADIDISTCGPIARRRTFVYAGDDQGFKAQPAASGETQHLRETIPPYSMTVLDIEIGERGSVGAEP